MLEIVLEDYRKHIYRCVFVQEIVLREETIECINRKYVNKTFVYVLETDLYRGCIKHMHKTYVLETDLYRGCIKHKRNNNHAFMC